MSQKEAKRVQVLDMLNEGKIDQKRASKRMGIRSRQVRHLSERHGICLSVKRANQTSQDRLIKKMRLAGINDMDTVNASLQDYNQRFAVKSRPSRRASSLSEHLSETGGNLVDSDDQNAFEKPVLPIRKSAIAGGNNRRDWC